MGTEVQLVMPVDLKTFLEGTLTDAELQLLVRSYDVVGDIAIIIIPDELSHREKQIGEAILANNKKIKVVAKRDGFYTGEFRTIPLTIIGGENRKETVHKEYGVRLRVNPEEVYFSVRSGTERYRVAKLVQPGEDVLVLFSGIAPYPLVIGGNSRAGTIVGVEKNPLAHRFGVKNCTLNRKISNIHLIEGDAEEVVRLLGRKFDRIVMPLPVGGERFLSMAIDTLSSGGRLHYYEMQDADGFSNSVQNMERFCSAARRQLVSCEVVKCGHPAPRTYRICVDAHIL